MGAETLSVLVKEIESINESIVGAHKDLEESKKEIQSVHYAITSLPSLKYPELVKESAYAQSNLEHTKMLLARVKSFDSLYTRLSKYIKRSTEEKTTKYLLNLHHALSEISDLKTHASSISEKVSSLLEIFDALLFTLIDALPEVIEKDGAPAYLKIIKIIDYEDAKTKKHRERLFETFLESIDRHFREISLSSSQLFSTSAFDFIPKNVSLLKKTESLLLPERYRIFSFSAIHYHRALYEFLDQKAEAFDPNEAISILLWTSEYYEQMENLGKSKSSLGPILLSEKEDFIISKYISAAKEKLTTWISNLSQMESKRFKERKRAPDLDSSNRFISVGFMDLLHIIRQQLEPIYKNEKIFNEISEHVLICSENFCASLKDTLDAETLLVLEDKAKSGFEEYTISLGNSGLKFMDCLHALKFYHHPLMQKIGEVFYNSFTHANSSLIKNISFVLSPATKHLFTKTWPDTPVSDSLISTFKDYFEDYKDTMIEYFFTFFISSIIKTISSIYIERLAKKHAYFPKEYISLLSVDRKKYFLFFSSYLSKESVRQSIKPFDFLISVSSADNVSLCLTEVKAFKKELPEEPPRTLQTILKRMPGGGKEFAAEVLKRADIN
ncbi:exocyst complex component 3 [Nematocida sp. LUAm3]|nr:exocyst complex component 3 [Nematocida sp. LUAm3]KAI5175725.1 exocyst complex component 3 [Nematocida sp. LUAm2]KAI5178631.1 exocyst complex component 3 [Nematocida sp. LUAm1]